MTSFSSTPTSISQKLLALMLFSVLAVAQSQAPAASQGDNTETIIKTRTQLVLLDVVATDHSGRPVTDLKREDFTVLERGQKQQLAFFDMVDTATRSPMPAGSTPAKLPPGVYSNHSVQIEGQLTVLLLDALNTPWADQAYSRRQMLKYLQKNHQTGQRMAVYGLTTSLRLLQDFTDDPEVLRQAIDKHHGSTSPLLTDASDQVSTIGVPDHTAASLTAFEEDQAAFQTDMRVHITVEALKAIGRQLSGYSGRKKLIWVSGSFPINLDPGENSGFSSQRSYGDDITATTSLLRDSQVSVYPIDAQGLVPPPMFSAAESGRGRNGQVMKGAQLGAEMSRLSALANAAHVSANKIADDTGGLAFFNRNDLDNAVMKSVADGAIYYALSYSPEDKSWDGKYRKIDVKVNRPGAELRYRKGYLAVDPNVVRQANSDIAREIAPALTGILNASALSFYGSARPLIEKQPDTDSTNKSSVGGTGKLKVDVRFLVDVRDMLFDLSKEKRQHCNIEFVVGVFAGDKYVNSTEQQLNCNLEQSSYSRMLKEGMVFRTQAAVPTGKSRLRLLVRDNQTGKMGSLDIPYSNEVAAK
ncbi:MAG: VWFA-related domain protein [Acidobacteriaceae bacterium]|nr:VWFA-related domain protein [Acidobacteriaceae bacterium]